MRKCLFSLLVAVSVLLLPSAALAAIHVTTTSLTTDPNGANDATGIWFNPLTGYAELRGPTFPNPLFEDGKYFLKLNSSYTQPEAEVLIEGFISRGNNIFDDATANLMKYGVGASIGAGSGFTFSGGGFTDLGPTFGNWEAGDHGFLGLVIRNPAGASASDLFYGYAEIIIKPDYNVTLLSFAYNDVQGASITTVSTVPEPTVMALTPVALAALAIFRRRKA